MLGKSYRVYEQATQRRLHLATRDQYLAQPPQRGVQHGARA